MRARAEARRLDLRALFRSIDRCHVLQNFPRELEALAELDADLAEALWVDQPGRRFDLQAMKRDTIASLDRVPDARTRLMGLLLAIRRLHPEDRSRKPRKTRP